MIRIKVHPEHNPVVVQREQTYNVPTVTGQVRWNGQNRCFEVCDNAPYSSIWHRIDNTIELQVALDWESTFIWARTKMLEEQKIEELIKKYPAVKDAKEKLDIILKLVQDESN
jgi:NADH:ubiquinone oxidoreductase subunit E